MGLLKSAATVSGLTFVSRITGLIRDILIASSFGAGPLTDAFWVAFRIPNLLRRLFAEGAFSQAFVPILGEARKTSSPEGLQQLLDRVALLLTVVLVAITALGIISTPWVVKAMASGLTHPDRQEEFEATVWMTRFMFPYIICMSLVALASGILNTWSRFAVPAFTPILLNVSMILSSVLLVKYFDTPVYALAVGVMIGGVLQLGVQWVALVRLGVRPRVSLELRAAWRDSTVRRILRQMGPAVLGVSVAQLSLLINTNIATWLPGGSVTWLSFADRLMEFPTALLGVALGTVLLPKLSVANASGDAASYNALLNWGLRLVMLLGLPAAIGMAMLSEGLVATLFNYGAFTAEDVAQTETAVMAYAAGLIGLLAVKILAPGFYAQQDIRTPVKIAITILIFTQLLNMVLVPSLAHAGLALSIGIGALANALLLLVLLRRRGIYQPGKGWTSFMCRMTPALAGLSGVLWYANQKLDWILLGDSPTQRLVWLAVVLLTAMCVYFGLLALAGFRPRDFTRRV